MNDIEFTRVLPPSEPLRANAIRYARLGLRLVPLKTKLKDPAIRRWSTESLATVEQVTRWWNANPGNNIGALIPDGYVVLDIDPRNGGVVPDGLPPTLTCWSGRGDGGRHLWFRWRPVGDGARPARHPGVDVKMPGRGYVLMPPSIHPATGQPYRWEEHPVADFPAALIAPEDPDKPKPAGTPEGKPTQFWPVGALVRRIETAVIGQRNHRLWTAAIDAQRQGHGDYAFYEKYLIEAAVGVGLDMPEIKKTLESAREHVYPSDQP